MGSTILERHEEEDGTFGAALATQHVSLMEAIFSVAIIVVVGLMTALYYPEAKRQRLSHASNEVNSAYHGDATSN